MSTHKKTFPLPHVFVLPLQERGSVYYKLDVPPLSLSGFLFFLCKS